MRRPRNGAGICFEKTDYAGTSHNLHRRPGRHQTDGLGGARPCQQYALQARRQIAALRRARPGIIIEIRWCPAHKGVEGNEKADEWAKVATEEPDTRGVEWLNDSDRTEARPMPLPRSLANLNLEISEKKCVEARRWAGGPTSRKKYKMPESHKPDGTIPESSKGSPRGTAS